MLKLFDLVLPPLPRLTAAFAEGLLKKIPSRLSRYVSTSLPCFRLHLVVHKQSYLPHRTRFSANRLGMVGLGIVIRPDSELLRTAVKVQNMAGTSINDVINHVTLF